MSLPSRPDHRQWERYLVNRYPFIHKGLWYMLTNFSSEEFIHTLFPPAVWKVIFLEPSPTFSRWEKTSNGFCRGGAVCVWFFPPIFSLSFLLSLIFPRLLVRLNILSWGHWPFANLDQLPLRIYRSYFYHNILTLNSFIRVIHLLGTLFPCF